MIVYKCIVSDSEILTDATDAEELFGGTILRCVGKYIEIGGEEEIDIGGNASAEGADADEGVDAAETQKANDRAGEIPEFKSNIQEALKDFTSNWNDFCIYVDEDYNTEGITVLCRYEGDDGATPHFYYIKHGLKEVKY